MSQINVEKIYDLKHADLEDLCSATEAAIRDGIGFNWVVPPMPEVLEAYWRGVMVVPERVLFVGRVDGAVAASIQLIRPGASKETQAFAAQVEAHFVAPWARGHGLAKSILQLAEREAGNLGFSVLKLSVRETQEAAIRLYEDHGYQRWGTLPAYEYVNARMVAGHHYYKNLEPITRLV